MTYLANFTFVHANNFSTFRARFCFLTEYLHFWKKLYHRNRVKYFFQWDLKKLVPTTEGEEKEEEKKKEEKKKYNFSVFLNSFELYMSK